MKREEIHNLILTGVIERASDLITVITVITVIILHILQGIHITIEIIHIAVIQETNRAVWLIICYSVYY